MPESTPDKDQHDTIESPYRISWGRLLKIVTPVFILFLAIAYWFVGIYTPSKIVAPSTTTTPDLQQATPSAKPQIVDLPVINLAYKMESYSGLEGSLCWPIIEPSGDTSNLCADTGFLDPSNVISISVGEKLTVEIDAHKEPISLTAIIYKSANEPEIKSIKLNPSLLSEFRVGLPIGQYIIHIQGVWLEGDVLYAFKIKIE